MCRVGGANAEREKGHETGQQSAILQYLELTLLDRSWLLVLTLSSSVLSLSRLSSSKLLVERSSSF